METETQTPRGPGRPPLRKEDATMRADDPREAAKRREQEILGTIGEIGDTQDEFWIDPKYIPEGWSWEWKRYSVLNEIQQSHINALKRTGWEFVKPDKYPVVPETNGMVILRGNALMERPASITEMMSERDKRLAKLQMETKAAQLEGKVGADYALDNKGTPIYAKGIAGAKKSYSPMPVPD